MPHYIPVSMPLTLSYWLIMQTPLPNRSVPTNMLISCFKALLEWPIKTKMDFDKFTQVLYRNVKWNFKALHIFTKPFGLRLLYCYSDLIYPLLSNGLVYLCWKRGLLVQLKSFLLDWNWPPFLISIQELYKFTIAYWVFLPHFETVTPLQGSIAGSLSSSEARKDLPFYNSSLP